MARIPKFTPRNTPKGWRINIPAKHSITGARERHFYPTRALAEEASKKLRGQRDSYGTQAQAIGPSLAEQATIAAGLLEPFGISLIDAARRVVTEEERARASSLIEAALEEFRRRKDDRSDKQVKSYRLMAEQLVEDFPERVLSSITGAELDAHIHARTGGPGAFNQRLRLISAFWRWAGRKPRKWCVPEELEEIERKDTVSGLIGTLRPPEAKKLMATAEKYYPETVPAFAIALFTGMRRQEIERLQPEDFTTDGIEVPAVSAKTKRRRFIQMSPPLAAWLKAYPIGETVLPSNWIRKEKAVRRLAGWHVWSDMIEPHVAPEDLPAWPENALRHTAASVALAIGKPIETLVFEHGHSGGLNVLRNHYIGRMTKKEAIAILSIGPHGKKLPVIAAA